MVTIAFGSGNNKFCKVERRAQALMETSGLRRHSGAQSKTLNNDEANGCTRSAHLTCLISHTTDYHPLCSDFIEQVGSLLINQAVTNSLATAFSFALNIHLNTTPRQLVSAALII